MPTVLHPRALAETDGTCPHRVVVGGQRYSIDTETGLVDLDSEQQAQELAAAHGVDRAAIEPDGGRGESGGSGESDTCEAVKNDGEVCGRDRPCPYHD